MAIPMRTANRQLMREINESIVLGLIRQHGPISRADIARTSRLSAATVTGITTRLIAHGLVSERAQGVSTGGRRPILLSFNSHAGIAIGIKITEHELVCVTTDLGGVEERRKRIPLPTRPTPDDVTSRIASEVSQVKAGAGKRRIAGLGVGIAGVVDRISGTCRLSPFLRWKDVPLRSMLEQATALPVTVENDVNTLTHAVRSQLVPNGAASFIVITVGRGIGLGMLLNGHPYRGGRGQGGEFGHITVDPNGPICDCGKRGCLEAVASIPALIRDAGVAIDRSITEAELRHLVASGDKRVAALAERATSMLGASLAMLVNILNPDMVVLSGEGAWLLNQYLSKIESAMRANVFDGLTDELQVEVVEQGDELWAAGAAGLLLDEMFQPRLDRTRTHGQED